MINNSSSLNPSVLASLGSLGLIAKRTVEGFLSGHHHSLHKGFNVEFTEHRAYQIGDEPRNIDWKVYGRTGKYYVKQFEEDISMRVLFVLDCSASMEYGQKWRWAQTIAACLSYLAIRKGDWVGLLCSGKKKAQLPMGNSMGHLANMISLIENIKPSGDEKISKILEKTGPFLRRRGLVVLISDLLEQPEKIIESASLIHLLKNDLIAFQVMDKDELEFPFKGRILFTDLESDANLMTWPDGIRANYLKQLDNHIKTIKSGLAYRNIDHSLITTGMPLENTLAAFLAKRMKRY